MLGLVIRGSEVHARDMYVAAFFICGSLLTKPFSDVRLGKRSGRIV